MSIIQINDYDFFNEWREKTNNISNLLGDLSIINLELDYRSNLVSAINKIITNNGLMSLLNTDNKTTLVGSINETYGLLTNNIYLGNPTITIGTKTNNIINVSIQLKLYNGGNLTTRGCVFGYLSDNINGNILSVNAPSGGISIGTEGLLIPIISDKTLMLISNDTGLIDIDIEQATTKTFYLVLVLPIGKLVISNAIVF